MTTISLPTQEQLSSLPKDERLAQAAAAASAAASTQSLVESLRSKAAALTDPKKRERMLSEAYDREIEARGLSKKARILKSGTFQGGVGGAGLGAATGVGLGTVVGTVVGGVVSIPTTAVGGLVGMGTGLVHGPWVKLGGKGGKEGEKNDEGEGEVVEVPREAVDGGAVDVDEKTGEVRVLNPEKLKRAAGGAEVKEKKTPGQVGKMGERRKPKKLEIRSKQQAANGGTTAAKSDAQSTTEGKGKRKPPKLAPRTKN